MRCFLKNFIILILIIGLLVSCSQNGTETENNNPSAEPTVLATDIARPDISDIDISLPEDIEDNPTLKIYALIDPFLMQPDEIISKWENNLRESFELNVEFNYIEYNHTKLAETIEIIRNTTALDGFLFIPHNEVFGSIMANKYNLISPISEFCNEDELPGYLSQLDKEVLTINGDLWALPGYNISHTYKRFYNQEYLESFEVESLRTQDGLLNLIRHLADNHKNTYFTDYNINYFFEAFMDIFMAYGLYPSIDYQIGYDPYKEEFRDVVLEPEFEEVYKLIMFLNDEKMLSSGFDYSFDDEEEIEREAISVYSPYSQWEDSYMVEYFNGFNTDQIICVKPKLIPWVMLKDTENKEEVLNEFISKIWNEPNARIAFNYGIDGYNYIINSNGMIEQLIPEGANPIKTGTVLGAIIKDYNRREVQMGQSSDIDEIDDNLKYYILKTVDLYGGVNAVYKSNLREFLKNTLESHMTYDVALEIYKANIVTQNLNKVLDNLNDQLN